MKRFVLTLGAILLPMLSSCDRSVTSSHPALHTETPPGPEAVAQAVVTARLSAEGAAYRAGWQMDRRCGLLAGAIANTLSMALAARDAYVDSYRSWQRGGPPPHFPGSAPRTPAVPCGTYAADPARWQDPAWQALDFAPYFEDAYSYQFESSGTGTDAVFTAYAFGDLDCDGDLSTYRVSERVRPDYVTVGNGELLHDME